MGIAPTGKQGMMTGIAISRIVGGKIAEEWGEMDNLGMMQQLGAVPPSS
jgi:predicted ester cyclase